MAVIRRMQAVEEPGPADANSVRLGFASSDRRHVDQHFGSATQLLVYRVDPNASRLLSVTQFGSLTQDGNEDKLRPKFAALEGCAGVYCRAVGPGAVRQLLSMGIQPLRVDPETPIAELLAEVRGLLRGPRPPRWLSRHLAGEADGAARFRQMHEAGWEE